MSDNLINLIKKSITNRISADVSNVQEVSNYEKNAFDGYPAVTVVCSGNENEYYSNAENMRTFAFTMRAYEQINRDPSQELDNLEDDAKERAEKHMGIVVSELINSFDEYFDLGGNPDGDFILAVPSAWGYSRLDNGWCRTADIKLQYNKSKRII